MPKRKREEAHPAREGFTEDGALRIRKSRLAAKIEQGTALLHRALKLARGFERQKLGRRQKSASENPQELHRFKEEVVFLKQLELAKTAENYLLKQLVRTKRIREAQAFVSLYGENADSKVCGLKSGAEANVIGRLMNSSPVKEVLPGIMGGIYGCLDLDKVSQATHDRRGGNQSSTVEASVERKIGCNEGDRSTWQDLPKLSCTEKDNQADTSSDHSGGKFSTRDEKLAEAASDPQDSNEAQDMAQFNGRLASSSASEGSDPEQNETSRTRSLHGNCKPKTMRSPSLTPSPSPSPSSFPSPSISPSLSPSQRTTAAPTSKLPTSQPPSNTTFLPSLLLGGYISGSDSDAASETEPLSRRKTHASGAIPALPQPRKNRRGQRARQQIAEKKHGRGAKHLQKQQQQQSKQGRDVGWDPRMGATAAENVRVKTKRKGWHGRRSTARGLKVTGANVEPVTMSRNQPGSKSKPKTGADAEAPVHPSWEAARKKKQQQQSQNIRGLFQGKKITF